MLLHKIGLVQTAPRKGGVIMQIYGNIPKEEHLKRVQEI